MNRDALPRAPRDRYGRPFDDLDAMRLHLMARDQVPQGEGYSIVSEDGIPMAGFVPIDFSKPSHHAVAAGWKATPGGPQ